MSNQHDMELADGLLDICFGPPPDNTGDYPEGYTEEEIGLLLEVFEFDKQSFMRILLKTKLEPYADRVFLESLHYRDLYARETEGDLDIYPSIQSQLKLIDCLIFLLKESDIRIAISAATNRIEIKEPDLISELKEPLIATIQASRLIHDIGEDAKLSVPYLNSVKATICKNYGYESKARKGRKSTSWFRTSFIMRLGLFMQGLNLLDSPDKVDFHKQPSNNDFKIIYDILSLMNMTDEQNSTGYQTIKSHYAYNKKDFSSITEKLMNLQFRINMQ